MTPTGYTTKYGNELTEFQLFAAKSTKIRLRLQKLWFLVFECEQFTANNKIVSRIFATRDLFKSGQTPYVGDVRKNYGHKRARNKRIGPGGGTRRLHQHPSFEDRGAEIGSTNV